MNTLSPKDILLLEKVSGHYLVAHIALISLFCLNVSMIKAEILTPPKKIAVVGLSDNPMRPSHGVSKYLMENGFEIIPVNPMIKEVFGLPAFANLSQIPNPEEIDIVDVFRQPEAVMEIVDEILSLNIKPVLWLQESVIAPEAKAKAEQAGITVIMNECMKKEHYKLQTTR